MEARKGERREGGEREGAPWQKRRRRRRKKVHMIYQARQDKTRQDKKSINNTGNLIDVIPRRKST